jgi:eukaryotic-like serine/threonine-protein kinase
MSASASPPPVDMQDFVGKTLRGTYLLKEFIHEGNFGAVYLSEQQFLGMPIRRVAVKLSKHTGIQLETARDLFADAFLLAQAMDEMTDSEARSHLVHVYDMGLLPEQDNRAYLVMEFIQGSTLADQFASYHRVPAPLLKKWTVQICRAIHGLHQLVPPVLHRDLKPDNVLLGVDRYVRVVDFGLAAKLVAHGYVPGVAGTLTYMAPETFRGESIPASDVYSIGMIMYEGLTGKRPFDHLLPPVDMPEGMQAEWIHSQKSRVRATPPSTWNNTVTPEMDAIVLRCLEFHPARRYLNAGELLQALEEPAAPADAAQTLNLEAARRLSAEGDFESSRQLLEQALQNKPASRELHFNLLYELGCLLLQAEDSAAVARLVEAWKLTETSAILRTRLERAALLQKIADAFRLAHNEYQAHRYEDLRQKELGGK